jgi:hypothetical protein
MALWCVLLVTLIAAGVYGILFIRATTAVVSAAPGEIQATRSALTQEVQATRKDLMEQVAGVRRDAVGQLSALQANAGQQMTDLRGDVMARLDKIEADANTRVGDTLTRVDTALGIVEGVRADLKPVLDGAAALEADTDKTVTDLHPQLLGLVAAGKVTAGEAATTMREIQRATPEIVASVKDAMAHIDAATEASATASANAAAVTGNLAAATKPLPRAVRVGLQIGGPVAQMTSYVILMLATLGVL